MLSAQGRQTFTGVITDSMCANGDHSAMQASIPLTLIYRLWSIP
jgi:hypothetical protein